MAAKIRKGYASVAATVALVIALGLEGARAAGLIGPGDIQDNAIRSRHLGFLLGTKGQFTTKQVTSNGGNQTLLTKTLDSKGHPGAALPMATVEVLGQESAGAKVHFVLFVDGKQVGGVYTETVALGKVQTITIPWPSPTGLPLGVHTFQLIGNAGSGDVIFRDRQLNVLMHPEPNPCCG